jgi:hypothetical protein
MVVTTITASKVAVDAAAVVDVVSTSDASVLAVPRAAHQIDAETKPRGSDPECVHVSSRSKAESTLRNAYRGGDGRIERRASRRAGHRAPHVNHVGTGCGYLR